MNPPAARPASRPSPHPTLALLEIGSLARGYVVADALAKTAAVQFLMVNAVTPGKLLVLYTGPLADVELAHAVGLRQAADDLIDQLLLPQADRQILTALEAEPSGTIEALGLVECLTVAAGLLAADAAAKAAPVRLLSLRAARGIGGRTMMLMTGRLSDVEAALAAATRAAELRQALHRSLIVPSLHPDLARHLTRTGER